MVITGSWQGRPITISVKRNCLTVSIDDPSRADVLSYDLAGRLWTAFLDGIAYRRGLDGRMLARWRDPGQERSRVWLTPDEALNIESRAYHNIETLYQAVQSGDANLNLALPDEGHIAFQRVIAFDEKRSLADAQRYYEIYQPIGILPPDQYMAVVLQATEGCSFNTCTFCSFYKNRPFRIKPPGEFRQHAQAVKDFLGEGLSLRRTIFLGDANALVVPMPRLLPLIETVHEIYDVESLGGVYAFLDGFSGEKKSAQDYAELNKRGLKRVYIGLESGSMELLRFLKKPGMPDDAVQAVNAMKAGGVAVGVIVLLGVGGHQFAEEHIQETIRVLNAMHLDDDDILYFSNLMVSEDMLYARDAMQAGLKSLTQEECAAQGEAIEQALLLEYGIPKISRYDIREFVY